MRESQRLRGPFSVFGRLPLNFTPYQSMGWGARRHFISAHSASHNHDRFIDGGRVSVNRYDFQPHGSQQLNPLRARALSRGESRHHCQVDLGRLPVHLRIREDHFVEQNDGLWTHGLYDVVQNLATFVIWPVMDHGSEVIKFCSWVSISIA